MRETASFGGPTFQRGVVQRSEVLLDLAPAPGFA